MIYLRINQAFAILYLSLLAIFFSLNKKYVLYGLLQTIELPQMPFFILIFNFILALLVSKEGYNALILVMCKFFKKVTLIKVKDIFIVIENNLVDGRINDLLKVSINLSK